jgi:chromosome segregation ATPase
MASMNNRLEGEIRSVKEKCGSKIASLYAELRRVKEKCGGKIASLAEDLRQNQDAIVEIEGELLQLKTRLSDTEEKTQQNHEFAALLQEILSPIDAKKINKQISEIYESIDMIRRRMTSTEEYAFNNNNDIHDCMDMLTDRLIKLEEMRYGTRSGIFQNEYHNEY